MISLFKNVSKKIKSLKSCDLIWTISVVLGIGYFIYYIYSYPPASLTNIRRKLIGNGNGNGNGNMYKEHFDNGEKTDEYYGNSSEAVLVTFYSFDFCGYCKQFKPHWEEAQTKDYPMKVKFRYIEANLLSKEEEANIPYYVKVNGAPCVILTHNGRNIKELDQQMNKPMRGLDEFIATKGQANSKQDSKYF